MASARLLARAHLQAGGQGRHGLGKGAGVEAIFVVDACKNMGDINVPIIVRLQGTNAEEAKQIIDESGLEVRSAILLKEAADAVADVLA